MAQSWYPFYVGDYQRKTSELSMAEHGAYRLMLDYYYATGHGLPNDNIKLYRICRATTKKERQTVVKIVSKFFTLTDDLWTQTKCQEVISKQLSYSNSQSAKAKLRHSRGSAGAYAGAMPTKTITKEEVSSSDFNCFKKELSKEELEAAKAKTLAWKRNKGINTLGNNPTDGKWLEQYEAQNGRVKI